MTYTDPPTNPSPLGISAAVGIVCLVAGVMLIFYQCACSEPPAKYPAYCTDEIAFTARLVACVDEAKTRTESRDCRKAVHERCGIIETVSEGSKSP